MLRAGGKMPVGDAKTVLPKKEEGADDDRTLGRQRDKVGKKKEKRARWEARGGAERAALFFPWRRWPCGRVPTTATSRRVPSGQDKKRGTLRLGSTASQAHTRARKHTNGMIAHKLL